MTKATMPRLHRRPWLVAGLAGMWVGGCTIAAPDFSATRAGDSTPSCTQRFSRVPATSNLQWEVSGDFPVTAPVVSGDIVVFGSNVTSGTAGCIVAVDAASGVVRWAQPDAIDKYTVPVAVDDRVIAAVNSGQLIAYDRASGERRWSARLSVSPTATPVVEDGVVYARSDNTLKALDAATGAERWSTKIASMGGHDTPFVNSTEVVASAFGPAGDTYGLDRTTGAVLWHSRVGATDSKMWAITPHAVVLQKPPNDLYGLDQSGTQHWSLVVRGSQQSPPVVRGDDIFFTGDDNCVHAVDATSGRVEWTTNVGAFTGNPPLLVDDTLVTVGSTTDAPWALDVVALDTATGAERWRTPSDLFPLPADLATTPFASGGSLYVGFGLTTNTLGGVVALDPTTGATIATVLVPGPVHRTLASDDQRLYLRVGDHAVGAIRLPLAAPRS